MEGEGGGGGGERGISLAPGRGERGEEGLYKSSSCELPFVPHLVSNAEQYVEEGDGTGDTH